MSTELMTVGQDNLPARQQPTVAEILQVAVSGGITAESVGVVERLCALQEKTEARKAEQLYAEALARLQSECSNVVATKDVQGQFRYAPLLDIWNAVRPHVERNGFTIQWSQDHMGDRIKKLLTLQHIAGHKRTFEWTIRIGSNAPGTPSGAQAPVLDEQADSRAKRRLLMDALNIVVDCVSPAEDVGNGALATENEWCDLRDRLKVVNGDVERFLNLAGVTEWAKIPKAKLAELQTLMTRKEQKQKGAM